MGFNLALRSPRNARTSTLPAILILVRSQARKLDMRRAGCLELPSSVRGEFNCVPQASTLEPGRAIAQCREDARILRSQSSFHPSANAPGRAASHDVFESRSIGNLHMSTVPSLDDAVRDKTAKAPTHCGQRQSDVLADIRAIHRNVDLRRGATFGNLELPQHFDKHGDLRIGMTLCEEAKAAVSLAMVGGSFCGGKTGWIEKSVRHLQG